MSSKPPTTTPPPPPQEFFLRLLMQQLPFEDLLLLFYSFVLTCQCIIIIVIMMLLSTGWVGLDACSSPPTGANSDANPITNSGILPPLLLILMLIPSLIASSWTPPVLILMLIQSLIPLVVSMSLDFYSVPSPFFT